MSAQEEEEEEAAAAAGNAAERAAAPANADAEKADLDAILVLHFDINKTIVLCDPVSGMSVPGMLQSCVSECSWGLRKPAAQKDSDGANENEEEKDAESKKDTWGLTHAELLFEAPSAEHSTYSDYLEYGEYKLVENPTKDPQVKALNTQHKAEKKLLKKTFTDPGHPGHKMRWLYEKIEEKLRIPEHLREACSEHQLKNLHGKYAFVLESFYRSLHALQKDGRKFIVVFRTFGTELIEVVEGFNAFCDGKHPFIPNPEEVDPENRCKKIELPASLGCICRDEAGVPALHLGTLHAERGDATRVIVGAENINIFLSDCARQGINVALRDDYKYWASQAEASHAGKVLGVDIHDRQLHHIFFDDNIERTHAHIVDCRDVTNDCAPVAFEVANNRWMVKSEPIQAILDPLYFRHGIEICERNLSTYSATND